MFHETASESSHDHQLPLPGSLIQVNSELFWYDRRSAEERPNKIYFVVDSFEGSSKDLQCEAETIHVGLVDSHGVLTVNLIVDGSPTWVAIDKRDFEMLCV
jgi:hypothetical protein